MDYTGPATAETREITKAIFGYGMSTAVGSVGFTDFGASGYAKLTDIPGATVISDLPSSKYVIDMLEFDGVGYKSIKLAFTVDGVDILDTAIAGQQLAGYDLWGRNSQFRIAAGSPQNNTNELRDRAQYQPMYIEGALKITAALLTATGTENLLYLIREIG
ncbi:MAG: hypothetical protein COB04_18410 [Gammaproteobacteria bacterium]|nr:MAG: hypothetical protein COB04_18410 [Gammaproteobacteria bacterium]